MIVPGSANPLLFSADDGYNLTRSLRFRSSASAYLSRTPATITNRQVWTYSAWVKLGVLGTFRDLISAGPADLSRSIIFFDTNNALNFVNTDGTNYYGTITTAVFRDPSAWYHIVCAIDTTQATTANRVKLYVNNVQQTATSAYSSGYVPQNANTFFNTTVGQSIGSNPPYSANTFFDGYLTETYFVDGQALTPSSFGETDTTTGVWKPKRYAGTYGTNGFYLPFQTSNSDNIIIYYPGTLSGSSVINVEGSTNGTKGSGVSSATGKVGTGLQFDGTINGYVDSGVSTNYTTAFSTALWVKTTSTNTQFLVSKGSYYAVNTSDFPFHLSMNPSGSISAALDSGNGDYNTDLFITSSTTGYNDGNWHHVVFTFTSSIAKIYVDGTEVASSSTGFSLSTTTHNWFLGRAAYPYSGGSPGNPYTGTLDDFRLYSRALTSAEASAIYSGVNTQVGIGSDASGNVNHWTPVNISLAPGVTYDSMTDVPTLTSATAANFAVLNPLNTELGMTGTLAGGNLDLSGGGGKRSTIAARSGKWYWEFRVNSGAGANFPMSGLHVAGQGTYYPGYDGNSFGYFQGGAIYYNGSTSLSVSSYTDGDVLGFAWDADTGKVYVAKNGTWQNSGNPAAGTGQVATVSTGVDRVVGAYNSSGSCSINFGQRPFAYTPPTGFVALNTYNLPTSTIVKGNTVMDATLYTGTGSALTVTNTASFKPDFVWIKRRDGAANHALFDSVRGARKVLISNASDQEVTETVGTSLTSFDSSGFSLGTNGGAASVNINGATFVGWQWQAGQGTTSTNTSGTITSTVSVNPTAGFSVVTYTGNGSANQTVGHGLGVAPAFVIVKARTSAQGWPVNQQVYTNQSSDLLVLNSSDAGTTAPNWFSKTSSTIGFPTAYASTNGSGTTHVAYCWAEIAGFSKFGFYTGNGSTDGPFVYTGFRPKFVLVKRSNLAASWIIWDSVRGSYNYNNNDLYPDLNIAEYVSPTDIIDMVSNGFKLRATGGGSNGSGDTFLYVAFAENPFKNSLAR